MKRVSHRIPGGRFCLAAPLLAAALVPRTAHAVEFGAGLIGVAGGNFQDKPDRSGLQPDINPGFGGLTIGGGLLLDVRFIKLLGLEVDVIRSSDHGSGKVTATTPFGTATGNIEIGQGAWHIPILAKATFGSEIVAPAIFLGPEIVAPSAGTVTVNGASSPLITEKADTYVMFTFGAGVEIKLPLPVLDLRIPVGLRGSYSPGVSSNFSDRTEITAMGTVYRSEWKFAATGTLGAALYF